MKIFFLFFLATLAFASAMQVSPVTLNANVDVNRWLDQQRALYEDAFNTLKSGFSGNRHKLDRDEMTKAVANHFGREGFNIVVVKSGNGLVSVKNVYKEKRAFSTACHCFIVCQTCYFDAYYAPKGVEWGFTNLGDGGYINWAFYGRYSRSGGYLRFH